jgi:group I intron endonuclease
MNKTGHIYKITNPSGKIYIGKTIRLSDRISYYKNNNKGGQKILDNSIEKYGWENHIFEVIDSAPVDQLNTLEIEYIQKYNSFHYENKNGMNLTKGGEGTLGRIPSKEQRQKLSDSLKGKKHSKETKQLMSLLKKGKPSNSTGKPCSEIRKQKISKANKGKLPKDTTIQNRNITRLKNLIEQHEAILQIDPISENIIKEWQLLPKEIAKSFNIYDTNIIKCLNNKNKTAAGFMWKYKK